MQPLFQWIAIGLLWCTAAGALPAQPSASVQRIAGDWWLDFDDGYGGWIGIEPMEPSSGAIEGSPDFSVLLLWRVGSPRSVEYVADGKDSLILTRTKKSGSEHFRATFQGNRVSVQALDAKDSATAHAHGARCPPMPPPPNLDQLRFGEPIHLLNGQDLTGWSLQPQTAKNGWRVEKGELVNETPKIDFGAYGTYGNLRTDQVFGDCMLHVEFNVLPKRNSGIFIRGLYEAQVVDRDSPMQGINGPGAIFGRVKPTSNAGLTGGQWQTYDLTLAHRHLSVKLNGELVIDNAPVRGCTGGALFGDVGRDGPVYLQGDHTSVRYRNIWLRPLISE